MVCKNTVKFFNDAVMQKSGRVFQGEEQLLHSLGQWYESAMPPKNMMMSSKNQSAKPILKPWGPQSK